MSSLDRLFHAAVNAHAKQHEEVFGKPAGNPEDPDNRLPGRVRDDLAAIARDFAAQHTVDELCYLSNALWIEAERQAEKKSRRG